MAIFVYSAHIATEYAQSAHVLPKASVLATIWLQKTDFQIYCSHRVRREYADSIAFQIVRCNFVALGEELKTCSEAMATPKEKSMATKSIFKSVFYLRSNYVNKEGKATVMLRIYLNGERISIGSTGIMVNPKGWSKAKNQMAGRSTEALSTNLRCFVIHLSNQTLSPFLSNPALCIALHRKELHCFLHLPAFVSIVRKYQA